MLHNKEGKSKGQHPRKAIHFLIVAVQLFAPFCSLSLRSRTTLISTVVSENLASHERCKNKKEVVLTSFLPTSLVSLVCFLPYESRHVQIVRARTDHRSR